MTDEASSLPAKGRGSHGCPSDLWSLAKVFGAGRHDPRILDRLDTALLRMKRAVVTPPATQLTLPSLGRRIDAAKAIACEAIDGLRRGDSTRAVSVKDVAHLLQLDHSTVSRLLAESEAEGLVHRTPDSIDRRRTTVSLTEDGRTLVEEISVVRHHFMAQMLADWTVEEVDTFSELLDRFSTQMIERLPGLLAQAAEMLGGNPEGPGTVVDPVEERDAS